MKDEIKKMIDSFDTIKHLFSDKKYCMKEIWNIRQMWSVNTTKEQCEMMLSLLSLMLGNCPEDIKIYILSIGKEITMRMDIIFGNKNL